MIRIRQKLQETGDNLSCKTNLKLLKFPEELKPRTLRVHLIGLTSRTNNTTREHANLFNRLLCELNISKRFRMSQTPYSYNPVNNDVCSIRFFVEFGRLKMKVCNSKECFVYIVEAEEEKIPANELFRMFRERLYYFFVEGNGATNKNWRLE